MWQCIFAIGFALFALVFGCMLADKVLGLSLACVVLGLWGVYHSINLSRLSKWLMTDTKQPITLSGGRAGREFGGWQVIFDKIFENQNRQDRHKERLTLEVQRLNRIIAGFPSAVIILNKKGRIEWQNERAIQYFRPDNLKLSFKEQVNDEGFSDFLDNHHAKLTQPQNPKQDIKTKLTLGQTTLQITLIPIESNATMLIAHDVSANEKLNISKNNFIANVSHELRTPLTVIQGFLEMLNDHELDRNLQLEFVGLMQKESARMLDLIEGLLTLSRLENEEKPPEDTVPVNLSDMMVSIYQEALMLGKTHHIHANIAPDIWVDGMQKELYSVFSNLIFNAIRHTDSGTNIDIHLSIDKEIVFFVKDDGEGIDGEHLVHLTERFYRVDKGRSRKTGGSGLGLAIAKHAIAHYGGVLQIDSQKNVGSIFKVVMPIKNLLNGRSN